MMSRYHVDEEQAKRVAATADSLYRQCKAEWGFSSRIAGPVLDWAARLHEIGLDISHDGYQRHGAYIAANADMPGFPRAEQRFLAVLIGGQRHRISKSGFNVLPESWREPALRLLLLLRLSVLLHRSRSADELPRVEFRVNDYTLTIGFDAAWLEANPLTVADLEREKDCLKQIGFKLVVA